jgi:hypothetical protein
VSFGEVVGRSRREYAETEAIFGCERRVESILEPCGAGNVLLAGL